MSIRAVENAIKAIVDNAEKQKAEGKAPTEVTTAQATTVAKAAGRLLEDGERDRINAFLFAANITPAGQKALLKALDLPAMTDKQHTKLVADFKRRVDRRVDLEAKMTAFPLTAILGGILLTADVLSPEESDPERNID